MTPNQIILIHGQDYKQMTIRLLEHIALADIIGDRSKRIGMKPNLVTEATAQEGAVTHPELLDGLLTYLQDHGFHNLEVMECSWVGSRTLPAARKAGILQVCLDHGVPFTDLQKDDWVAVSAKGMNLRICKSVKRVEYLINLPVLKGHCQTVVTCAMKNLKGLIPNSEKRRFHTLGLHKPIAHLASAIRPNLILVDNICGDLDFEEGGNPVPMNRIFCCVDPVLCDSFVCQTMGIPPAEVPYIGLAEKLGVGTTDLSTAQIISLNQGAPASGQRLSRRVRELERYVAPKEACSACYGMLLHALDKLDRRGELWGHQQKIAIGQGYKGQGGPIGVGSCTRCCDCSLAGCPPSATEILSFLEENWI